jgi:hypothetical protein
MSDGSTLRLPTPPLPPPAVARRSRRWIVVTAIVVLGLLAVLASLDRVAAAYAENRIANQIQGYGFPSKPAVTVEGFPFLTQVITGHLDGVHISSDGLRAGPVTASIDAQATRITLSPGYHGGVISRVTGTGLIAFSSIASLADSVGAPGLKISAAGPHSVKLRADLDVISATATARVIRTGADKFKIHIVSAGGIPPSVLGPVRNLTVQIPTLPLGLRVHGLHVTTKGVVIEVTGSNVSFGN